MSEAEKIRLLVVDDQELMRDGLVSILQRQPGIEVVGTADDGQVALRQVEAHQPDVVLMDVRMPVMDGVVATAHIQEHFPEVRVLMLTTFDDDEYVIDSLQNGAVGYILKNVPAQDLADAVRLAARGIVQLDPTVASRLVAADETPGRVSATDSDPAFPQLTPRENEVILLLAQGASNREIAQRLIVSEGTVKSHVSSIIGKLGLRDRTQIAVFVHQSLPDTP